MTEPKPYWIGGAKDGRFSCMLVPLKMDGEPLSTKELRERIGKEHGTHYEGCWQDHPTCLLVRLLDEIDKQNMTIDRLLADKSHYMEVVRKLYDDIKVVELWIEHGVPGYAKKRLQDVKAIIDNVLDK